MRRMLREAMAAGAAGLSSSAAPTHLDIDDRPVPSRLADRRRAAARWPRSWAAAGAGSIAFLPASAVGGLDDADKDYLIELGRRAGCR